MAISISVLTSGTQAFNGASTSFTTASVSPAANRLILLVVADTGLSAATTPTGNGLTWEQVGSIAFSANRCIVWRAMSESTPSSGGITSGTSGANGYLWAVLSVSGVEVGANGANAIVQNPSASGSSSPAVTLSAFGHANNATFMATAALAAGAPSGVAGTGFTELVDLNVSHPSIGTGGIYVEWQNANDTTADYTGTNTTIWAAIALELKAGGISKTLSNSRSTSASVGRIEGAVRTVTNSRSTSGSVARSEGAKRSLSNSRTGSGVVARINTVRRSVSISRAGTNSLVRRLTARRNPSRTGTMLSSASFVFTRHRTLLKAGSITASVSRRLSSYYRTVTNSRTSSASVLDLKATFKAVSNSRSTSAAMVRSGSTYLRAPTNSRSSSFVVNRIEGAIRVLSNSTTTAADLVRGIISIRGLSNTRDGSMEVDWHIPIRLRQFTSSIATSAVLARKETAPRALINSRSTTVTMNRITAYSRLLTETLTWDVDLARGHGQKRRLNNHRNSNSLLKRKFFRALTRSGTFANSVAFRKGYYRLLSRTGSTTSSVERSITLSKRLWFYGTIQARLFSLGGWAHDEFEPITNQIRTFVQRVGVFFNPRDPGYDD